MNGFLWGPVLALCLVVGSSSAHAFDCAKAYLPVDFVICSDPAVLKANEAHEKAWYETRARLNDAEKHELLEDQRRWLREFPPRCSVPAQGKRLATISRDTQLCAMRALEERQAFLEQYHNHAREVQSSTQTAAQPAETQATTGSMPSGQSSAAGAASNQSPSANKQTKDEMLVDISKYTCQDMITDARDNNGSKGVVAGAALIIAYTHAHDKLFPNNTTYNLDIEKFVKTVEQNCEAGEHSVLVENVVENLLKQDRNSATAARSPAATRPAESQAAAAALSQSAASCAKFTSLANSALNSMFGTTNHSGSWVPLIINLAQGDSGSGGTFRNILAEHTEAGRSIGQLIAAFVASEGGGLTGLFSSTNGITSKALLLGLALEPQSFQVIHQATIQRYGVVGGTNAVRNIMQAVMNQVAEGAGQQREQVNAALQANFGATGTICSAQ